MSPANTQSPSVDSRFRRFAHDAAELPDKLESNVRAHPLSTMAVVAGIAFVAGTVAGSRLLRSLAVAAAPAVALRLLDGPLGRRLDGYFKGDEPSSRHVS